MFYFQIDPENELDHYDIERELTKIVEINEELDSYLESKLWITAYEYGRSPWKGGTNGLS